MARPRTPQSISQAAPAVLTPQRQMSMAFESLMLQGMTEPERASALTALANLLLQAAAVPVTAAGGHSDER